MRTVWSASRAVALVLLAVALPGTVLAGHTRCVRPAAECAAAMREMYQVRGWSGLETDEQEDGTLLVRSVLPNSPADRVGIAAGDLLVSMNGVTLSRENAAKIQAMKTGGLKIGDKVAYGVKRGKEITTLDLRLEKIPDAVLTSLIERHSREEHQVAKN